MNISRKAIKNILGALLLAYAALLTLPKAMPADPAPRPALPNFPEYLDTSFLFPLRSYDSISSKFGMRPDPFSGEQKMHYGLDIAAPEGTPVFAARSGTVTEVAYSEDYGNYVLIDHGTGIVTRYAHNSALLVSKDQAIKKGDLIALVGHTGKATGPHLHFEVIVDGEKMNPLDFVSEPASR